MELHFHEFDWKLGRCAFTFDELINRCLLWRRLPIRWFFDVSAEVSQVNWLFFVLILYLIFIDVIISWTFWFILYAFCCWKLRSWTISIDLTHLHLYSFKRFVGFNRSFYIQKGGVTSYQSIIFFGLLWLLYFLYRAYRYV